MASSYGDAVLDFDLDFLHQNNDVTVLNKLDRQKKAVLVAKKKTVATDSLIKKYYEKKEVLDQIEKNLFESKEECKQVCIDYRNALQKVTYLEENEQKLRIANQELEERCAFSNNRYSALQSHTNQLQLLIKDHETKFEAMEIESQLQKSNTKECEKKVSSLEREKDVMFQHILLLKEIVLGKKKLNKKVLDVLKKYKTKSEDSGNVSASESEAYDSCHELEDVQASWKEEVFMDCNTQETTKLELEPDLIMLESEKILKSPLESILDEKIKTITSPLPENLVSEIPHQNIDSDHDSDGSTEILLSVDTGRGSSLAFSDNEKCFLSPDHLITDVNLPNSVATPNNAETASYSDITSSRAVPPSIHTKARTSIFDDLMESETRTKSGIIPERSEHHELGNTALSSILNNVETSSDAVTFVIDSPTDDEETTNQFEDESYNGFLKPPIQTPQIRNTTKSEMESLELNNINTNLICEENSNDYEVSFILNKMKLHYSKVSPLPPSPTLVSSCNAAEIIKPHSCQEAAEIREENKVLHANIASLAQQVMEIKSLLKNHCNNLVTGPTVQATDEEVPRQTNFPNPDEAREFKEVSCEYNLVDKKFNKCFKETQEKQSLAQKEVVRQSTESSVIGKNFERTIRGAVVEPTFAKREVGTVHDKEIPSEMQTQQLVGENHDRQVKEVERSTSPSCEEPEKDKKVIDALTVDKVNKEVEMGERAEGEDLIQLSELCDDAQITNTFTDDDEPTELYIFDKPQELLTYESIETAVINTTVKSHPSEGRMVEKIVFEDPALTEDNTLQIENFTPVKNAPINSCQSEGKIVEKILFDDPVSSEEVENVECPEEQATLSNNCDINLKLDDVCNNNHTQKNYRKSKLTKLEKIRKRLQPKNKIKVAEAPKKPKKLKPRDDSNGPMSLSEKTELNDKAAYEKALAVVTELRAKQKTKNEKAFITRSGRVRTRSDCNDKTLESEVTKRIVSPQVLKFRQSPRLLSDENKKTPTSPKGKQNNGHCEKNMSPPECDTNLITTRSRSKVIINTPTRKTRKSLLSDMQKDNFEDEMKSSQSLNGVTIDGAKSPEKRSSLKRPCVDSSEVEIKRKLRSFNGTTLESTSLSKMEVCGPDSRIAEEKQKLTVLNNEDKNKSFNLPCKDYGDMDIFTETIETVTEQETVSCCTNHPKESILCKMIEKHGICKSYKFGHNKIPANITESISNALEHSIATIKELPAGQSQAEMDRLVDDIKALPYKHFLSGITKFLKEPARKTELFNKITSPPAPPMTKSEQILLYLISQVKTSWAPVDIVNEIMANIEFSLFRLGQAPEFDAIETLAHFYAVLCRFSKAKNRLRLFILDAMYCLAYKAIPLIKTCIDVWTHVLPLSHMRMAKSPLVICIVYLLHYYKCEDGFKRVQEIRFLLKKRYSFEMTEWNETRMLDMLKNAILELRENPTEKKMLRTAFIIIAKRQGTKWCQNNLLKKILLPLIDKDDLSERAKDFCVSMLGPLMKPYPNDMKVHCEIVLNQLFDVLEQNVSQRMQEAIFTSLLYIQRHDTYRVTQALLSWRPQREISRHLEDMLREFVRYKPIKVWTRILANYT